MVAEEADALKTDESAHEADGNASGGMPGIALQAALIHAPGTHGAANAPSGLVVADAADEYGGQAEALEVPGDVERSTAQHFASAWKTVEQHFAKDANR